MPTITDTMNQRFVLERTGLPKLAFSGVEIDSVRLGTNFENVEYTLYLTVDDKYVVSEVHWNGRTYPGCEDGTLSHQAFVFESGDDVVKHYADEVGRMNDDLMIMLEKTGFVRVEEV